MYPENRDQIIAGLIQLNDTLTKLIQAKDKETEASEEALDVRCKAIKGMVMQVDNTLGEMRDMLDTMEYYQDEKFDEATRVVNELEENTSNLIEYLRSIGRY